MRRSRFLLSALMCEILILFSGSASADLTTGTPKFTITAPTKNTDGSTIPATGPTALKEWRLYCDAFATPKVITLPALSYQTTFGDIGVGSHSCQATISNNAGEESDKTNPLVFDCPKCMAPSPAVPGLNVQ